MADGAGKPFDDLLQSLKRLIARYEQAAGRERAALASEDLNEADVLFLAELFYTVRRDRSHHFANDDIFGEPGWDILLDLFIAQSHGKRVSVSSACIASGVAQATALRWIAVLEELKLIKRLKDPSDARRTWLRLTPEGAKSVRDTLLTAARKLSRGPS